MRRGAVSDRLSAGLIPFLQSNDLLPFSKHSSLQRVRGRLVIKGMWEAAYCQALPTRSAFCAVLCRPPNQEDHARTESRSHVKQVKGHAP